MSYNRKSGTCLSVSVIVWLILCVGLLLTIYYYKYQVDVHVIVKTTNNSYIAAVIDYSGLYGTNYGWSTLLNLYQYVAIIRRTSQFMVDIVVFPECGLFVCGQFERDVILNNAVSVPSVAEEATPCDNYLGYDDVISRLSCAAKESNIYVAVTVTERFCPDNCTANNTLLYFTEVVFDRNGRIIARYRKYNLYIEEWIMGINRTESAELATFETDFNETFGIAICFDLIFQDPTVKLVKEKQVTSIIYSNVFGNTLPFFSAPSVEAGWSYAMDVNLLSSSIRLANLSFPGSNIYFGRNEWLHTSMVEYINSKIIMATIPKNGDKHTDDIIVSNELKPYPTSGQKPDLYAIDKVLNYTTVEPLFSGSHKIVHYTTNIEKNDFNYNSQDFNCSISVMWKNNNVTEKPNYKFLAYTGLGIFSVSSLRNYVEICGLVLCSKEGSGKCPYPPDFTDSSKITIVSLNIVAMSWRNTSLTIPITLNSDSMVIEPSMFSFNTFTTTLGNRELKITEMNLKTEMSNSATFGVFTLPQKSTPYKGYDFAPYML